MPEQAYNSQMMTKYLLGSLTEEDTEHFDELSITDDEFADALRVAENELVDAYAAGELTGAESERFKSHYLVSPSRREKAGFAENFQEWSREKATEQTERSRPEGGEKRTMAGWFSGLGVFSAHRPAWQWGTAFAALALLVAGGWLVFESMRFRQQASQTQAGRNVSGGRHQQQQQQLEEQRLANEKAEQELARVREESERLALETKRAREEQRLADEQSAARQPQPSPGGVSIASFILTPQMRDLGQMAEVSIPPDRNHVVMHLQLEPNEFRAYRVYLLDGPGGKALWRSSILRARTTENGKTLDVGFRSFLLKQGTYTLQVSGLSAGRDTEVVGDYRFKVLK